MRYIACLLAILSLSGCISSVYEVPVVGNVLAGQGDTRPFEKPLPINTQPKRLALGSDFAIGVKEDGTVWSWGYGMLGLGKFESRNIPQVIPNMTDFIEVAAGSEHVLALRKDGTVWSWGDNEKGALGYKEEGIPYGNPPNIRFSPHQLTPKQIPDLKEVVSIAAGSNYSLALDKQGRVWSIGVGACSIFNYKVEDCSSYKPIVVYENLKIKKMTSDGVVGFILEDGTGLIFGKDVESMDDVNEDFVKNKNFANPYIIPVKNIVDIVSTSSHIMVLRNDQTVWILGSNFHGGLAQCDYKINKHKSFVQVKGLKHIKAISNLMAWDDKGDVWAWGVGTYPQMTYGLLKPSANRYGDESCAIKIGNLSNVSFFAQTSSKTLVANDRGEIFEIGWPKNNFKLTRLSWSWK